MIPLYGFLEGDTMGLVILAQDDDTVADLGAKLQQAACLRVAPRARVRVVHEGRALDPRILLSQAGLEPLDRFDVLGEEGGEGEAPR